jgi:hypothetical protein
MRAMRTKIPMNRLAAALLASVATDAATDEDE